MITLLTATGAREKAFGLCQLWMSRQDYVGDVRWIIVDDGPVPSEIVLQRDGWAIEHVRREPFWSPGQNTQSANMIAGLRRVGRDDRLIIVEDDDHYAPDWLTTAAAALDKAELVGEFQARYYNVANRRARQLNNSAHASLCSTALRGSAIDRLMSICERNPKFIDIELWKQHRSRYLFGGNRVVGIKGLPGRGGIGMGHSADFAGIADNDCEILRKWVGADAELYA